MVLKEKHYEAIELFLEGNTKVDIAKQLKVSRGAVTKWFADEEFMEELHRREQQLQKDVYDRLNNSLGAVTDRIISIATDPNENSNTSLTACNMIYDRVLGKATTNINMNMGDNPANKEEVNLDDLLNDDTNNVINIDKIAK